MNEGPFELSYILASCMYGEMPLAEIVPEVKKIGSEHIDIWPRVHGNQREQVESMGHEAFAELLHTHGVGLGISTRFELGPFGLEEEMQFAHEFGAFLIVCGSKGPKDLAGDELRAAVADFAEALKPHIAAAEKHGITIGIEN
ncbi:MAG: sugar phosphate isomerase/epimerase, partial [Candidatus Poribacteria bacterium]|nr:sugar phosphate isomerase/epimerase [Candidatus Poribacteria bacterium]